MNQGNDTNAAPQTSILQHIATIRSGCSCGCKKTVALDASAAEDQQVVIIDGPTSEIRMSREQFRRFVDIARANG
jgi:ABC-type Na+ transport system ATPase subunit NatA